MIDSDRLQELTGKLLMAARKAGADQADALAVMGTAVSIDVRQGRLEQAESADGIDIGLRVLIGGRQATISASDHSDSTIDEIAARAVAMARVAPVDDALGLADPDQLAADRDVTSLDLYDDTPPPTPEGLRDLALRAEAGALGVKGITQVESANASASSRAMWMRASNGFSGGYLRTGYSISTVAITGEGLGMERDWAGESRSHSADLPTPEEIGQLAGQRTVERHGARKPPTGTFPILYDQRVSSGLIGHLLGAVNGAAIARGSSWLLRSLGEQILPAWIDLREEPHLPRMGASRKFDGEGLPTAARDIIRQGVLMGWTLDLTSGRKLGMDSTANASRGVGSAPAPGVTNIAITPGTATPEALIREMGRGLLVTSMLGASINPTTGDYSRGAAGFWVENGEIAYPVNECTIAGNLIEMLATITPANDVPAWRSHAIPSLLVEGLTVAGA